MSFPRLLVNRETHSLPLGRFKREMVSSLFASFPFQAIEEVKLETTVNCMAIDSSDEFLLIGDHEGNVHLHQVEDSNNGFLTAVGNKLFSNNIVNAIQWFPADNGMFSVTSANKVCLIDTNSLTVCESHCFGSSKLFWSDWNHIDHNLISVGASSSSIRLIDIRSGSALHQITISPSLVAGAHNVTRVLWAPFDSECLFAGDSSGSLHVCDIRNPRRSLQTICCEHSLYEPITCIQPTVDKMNIITCQGLNNKMNLWSFKNKLLKNSNINYQFPYVRRVKKGPKSNLASTFLKCQIYVNEDLVFSPVSTGVGDVIVTDLWTGENVSTFNAETWNPKGTRNVNAVVGLNKDSLIVFSGGKKCVRVWSPFRGDPDRKVNPVHEDNWSDSE